MTFEDKAEGLNGFKDWTLSFLDVWDNMVWTYPRRNFDIILTNLSLIFAVFTLFLIADTTSKVFRPRIYDTL